MASAGEPKRPREGDTAMRDEACKRLRETAAGGPDDTYRPIAAALKEPLGVPVCLFAVVAQIGPARPSRGTDFTVTLRIVDESRKAGISATFFAQTADQLPRVKSSGDVISLHNVVIQRHGDLCVTFNKKFSSFALFESKVSAECSPYQTSVKYHGTKHDKEHLTQMRTWLPLGPKDFGLKDLELQLKSLKSDSTFDLVCKVLHVLQYDGKWIFYVWDGTDTPAAKFEAISDAEALASPPLPREVLCTMPCVGTVLRIFSDRPVKEVLDMQQLGYWARFWNITCEQDKFGIWKGNFLNSSGVRLLSLEDDSVVDRLKMYGSRIANKVHRQPMASFPSNVTVLPDAYEKEGYSTLMESLTHPKVTHVAKTLVRVVAAKPCGASELGSLLKEKHCIRLTLEDPTARIRAYVHKDELDDFFGGNLTEEVIIEKMKKLLGVPEDSQEDAPLIMNPPWIWCILMSYYRQKTDPWGSRRFLIIHTKIRD